MKIIVVGLSHKTAPVAVREKLAFTAAALEEVLPRVAGLPAVAEAVILSTCNRVEFYLASRDADLAVAELVGWLAQDRQLEPTELETHLYVKLELEAIIHGFRVAASLDSLVVGEPQILGQMKDAYHLAVVAKSAGTILHKYFHRAFQVAKRVRTETAIAEHPVSIAYAAVELARKIFGRLQGHSCLLIGAGEMCELAARHLVANGVTRVMVVNRTWERAVKLAEQFSGTPHRWEELEPTLVQSDIVISSTGATDFVVRAAMVERVLKQRRQRPMFFIDIAVPRDIDPAVGELDSAFRYDIDDLGQIVEGNQKIRGQAAAAAEAIVTAEAPEFVNWLERLDVVPVIVSLRSKLEQLREQELEKGFKNWPELDPATRKRVEALARLLVNKILHTPVSNLKELAAAEDGELYLDATRRIFDLE